MPFWCVEVKMKAVFYSETEPDEVDILDTITAEINEGGGVSFEDLNSTLIWRKSDIPPSWNFSLAWKRNPDTLNMEGGPLIQIQEKNFK